MEPGERPVRHSRMRLLGTALLLPALLTLAGCGNRTADPAADTAPKESGYHGCTPDNASRQGSEVARADLDGDGSAEQVRLVGAAGPCPDSLLVVTDTAVHGTDVRGLDLVEDDVRVVTPQDGGDLLLLDSAQHPRGGSQPRLFGADGAGGIVELTVDGNPVIPFVATDGGGEPMTATCPDDGGIAVVSATPHQPPGIVLAWDIRQTTYDVGSGGATATGSSWVKQAAADPLVRKEMPELFSGELFPDCSSPA